MEDSKIEWTTHTFNPWRGCTKVSHGCTNCYAETLSHRNPKTLGVWGDKGTRVVAADAAWKQPIKWNKVAAAAGERHRVFCASLADVFEDRPELVEPRARLTELIEDTPHLDWLLLTKRPENIARLWDEARNEAGGGTLIQDGFDLPSNVWIGTSVEDQETANARIPHLIDVPTSVRFLSMEPLLGPVELGRVPYREMPLSVLFNGRPAFGHFIQWVIVGGESGPGARPMHPQWARDIRDQCVAAGVPFFFKQWGSYQPLGLFGDEFGPLPPSRQVFDGKSFLGWQEPDGQFYSVGIKGDPSRIGYVNVGKQAAGRILDGKTWDWTPKPVGVTR